jgi:predicted nucleic-acid-binding Zn-ribbon protein
MESKIRDLAFKGTIATKIAEELSLHEETIRKFCKKNVIELKLGNTKGVLLKITPEMESKIEEFINQGLKAKEISQKIGTISRSTVENYAKSKNLKLNKSTKSNIFIKKYDEFEKLLREGNTLTKAREISGLSGKSAYIAIKERNLREFVRTRAEASLEDKALSIEDAQSRIPDGQGKIIERTQSKDGLEYKIQTDDGHIYSKITGTLKQGDPRGKSGTLKDAEDVTEELFAIGYQYMEGWTKSKESIKAKHIQCGYIRKNRLSNFRYQDCPKCSNSGVSKEEIKLKEWVESLGFNAEKYKFASTKTNCKSLDIYIPEKKLAIEYNGLYWHSLDVMMKANKSLTELQVSKLHIDKMKMANSQGIRLLTIFSHEWSERQFQVKNFIKSTLGICDLKIGARKTEVSVIEESVGYTFMDKNHIQGSNRLSKVYFGLFYDKKLVGVMSLGRHHRKSPDPQSKSIVLDRLCFEDGVCVQGGASKLINTSKEWAKTNNYTKIISWSDNRWSEGKVYEKMGFTLEEELKEDYFYIKGSKVFSKQSLKKTELDKLTGKTEKEIRMEEGYSRIYDCGKKRWIFNL